MLLLLFLVILSLAFFVGLVGNITGIGGGVMIILFLIYGFNFSPLDAAGLSLLTIVFSSLTGFVQDVRQKIVDFRLFFIIAAIAVMGAVGGTLLAKQISSGMFKGVFSLILIALGIYSVYSSRKHFKAGAKNLDISSTYGSSTGIASLIAGVVSGFIGIGIGGIIGTYLTAIKRIEPKIAIGTIIAATLPVTIAGTAMHYYFTGFVNIVYAPPLVIGAFTGGILGSWIVGKAPQMSLRYFQGYIIIAFGAMSALLYLLSTL